ncbi:hypothetical protein ACP8HI_03910 [Paenibacillus sp. FA6]|uniref:hypothetical protein n=1 Tax=Paenibacillus sp. FA6 TaxID=3413029 RepID=UPI003F657B81
MFVGRMKVYPTSTILLRSDNRMRKSNMVLLMLSNQSIVEWRKLGNEVISAG